MKIALGMIVRSLDSDAELMRFINNSEKFGHKIDCVIVAYTRKLDPDVEGRLKKKIPFYAIDINHPQYCHDEFCRLGVSEESTQTLLKCPIDTAQGLVPYGYNRTLVVVEAIIRKMDMLFFVDSDVLPDVLKNTPTGPVTAEVDFFGAHLRHIKSNSITTSEYSGYNILPHASFDGMEALLAGVQKSNMLEYWKSSEIHRCLALQSEKRIIVRSTKVLGGNCAFKLSVFATLPPFFSTYYTCDGMLFLGRGEDTLIGVEIAKAGVACVDIGLNPLHDTYKNFPKEPDLLGDPDVQERLYYACTGWVGRNPFLNYILGNDLNETRAYQRERLILGMAALSKYTSNPKFNSVIKNFDESWGSIGRYMNEHEALLEAWSEFTRKIGLSK
ncbi:MAG: hypothetical protein FWC66_00210 [Oscillospiraceae bacterium]|nr:hypothetical protein [Oscillospiraceae bacterium]